MGIPIFLLPLIRILVIWVRNILAVLRLPGLIGVIRLLRGGIVLCRWIVLIGIPGWLNSTWLSVWIRNDALRDERIVSLLQGGQQRLHILLMRVIVIIRGRIQHAGSKLDKRGDKDWQRWTPS